MRRGRGRREEGVKGEGREGKVRGRVGKVRGREGEGRRGS